LGLILCEMNHIRH